MSCADLVRDTASSPSPLPLLQPQVGKVVDIKVRRASELLGGALGRGGM